MYKIYLLKLIVNIIVVILKNNDFITVFTIKINLFTYRSAYHIDFLIPKRNKRFLLTNLANIKKNINLVSLFFFNKRHITPLRVVFIV